MPLVALSGPTFVGQIQTQRAASSRQIKKNFSCSICNFTQLFCQNTLQARGPPLVLWRGIAAHCVEGTMRAAEHHISDKNTKLAKIFFVLV